MKFASILFLDDRDLRPDVEREPPEFFRDLNLDRIISAVTAGREEYNLGPFFRMPLHDTDAIAFRHEVMRDLGERSVVTAVKAFAEDMRATATGLIEASRRHHARQKQRWFLEVARRYGRAVDRLSHRLSAAKISSRGFRCFTQFLSQYVASDGFRRLVGRAEEIAAGLSAIRYRTIIEGLRVEVRPYEGEPDFGAEIAASFAKFDQGDAKSYRFEFSEAADVSRVEGDVLDLVAQMHHGIFAELGDYSASNLDFMDPVLLRFNREVQFYIAWLDFLSTLAKTGLHFCYPGFSDGSLLVQGSFDLALAVKLLGEGAVPVRNDFSLSGDEQIIVVTGPNQSGKSTFARTFGQVLYFGSLGCPVAGTEAQLHLADGVFTHFEREENAAAFRGKLQDDLLRIRAILESATPRSVIVINELFASTTLEDALFLSRKITASIMELGAICVWVTFLDELSSLSEKTVSMAAEIPPTNPELRTFRIVRRPANGLAYAMAIARKHGLTYELLAGRIRS
ncbi:MAG: MutS-related protein [Rhizomicrobium sp.]